MMNFLRFRKYMFQDLLSYFFHLEVILSIAYIHPSHVAQQILPSVNIYLPIHTLPPLKSHIHIKLSRKERPLNPPPLLWIHKLHLLQLVKLINSKEKETHIK
jgi:hypothetical protein